ncbi:MAG: hypothetical protein Q4A62_04000 [Eikenella sp.]|nr:hypothetical protein [Eikenella sp.]
MKRMTRRQALALTACLAVLPAAAQNHDNARCMQASTDIMELLLMAESCTPEQMGDKDRLQQGFAELNRRVNACYSGSDAKRVLPELKQRFQNHPLNPDRPASAQAQQTYCTRAAEHAERILKPYLP